MLCISSIPDALGEMVSACLDQHSGAAKPFFETLSACAAHSIAVGVCDSFEVKAAGDSGLDAPLETYRGVSVRGKMTDEIFGA